MKQVTLRLAVLGLLLNTYTGSASETTLYDVRDMKGQQHSFASILDDGITIALVFWQTWCGPCKKEAPHIQEASQKYAGKIQFFGVISGPDDVVDEEKIRNFVREQGLTYPQIRDRELVLTSDYEVKGTPTIIVLGASGAILYQGHRPPKRWEEYAGAPTK